MRSWVAGSGWDVADLLPDGEIAGFGNPTGAQVVVVELVQIVGNPAADVHTVGHMADADLVDGNSWPGALPHFAAHLAVEAADAVAVRGHAQSQGGHDEFAGFRATVVAVFAVERDQVGDGHAELLDVGAKVFGDEIPGEAVKAGGDGGVGGEDGGRLDGFASLVEVEIVLALQVADAFEGAEGGVDLVEVIDGGVITKCAVGVDAPMPRTISWKMRVSLSPP
jgi:hypothetical protein